MFFIDLNINHVCNFRCKYCFERDYGYDNKVMSDRTIEDTAKFLNKLFAKYPTEKFAICGFGGEPLLEFTKFSKLVHLLNQSSKLQIRIVTNGSLILDKQKEIIELQEFLGPRLFFAISYDYSLQDNRCPGTYQKVRDGIKWIKSRGIKFKTITVFTYEGLAHFDTVCDDYVALVDEIGGFTARYNIDRKITNEPIDIHAIKASMQRANKKYEYRKILVPNGTLACKVHVEDNCNHMNIMHGIDYDGKIYPACNAMYGAEPKVKFLNYGTIYDDLDTLQTKQQELFKALPLIPEKCRNCVSYCRQYAWSSVKDDATFMEQVVSDNHCKLMRAICSDQRTDE